MREDRETLSRWSQEGLLEKMTFKLNKTKDGWSLHISQSY